MIRTPLFSSASSIMIPIKGFDGGISLASTLTTPIVAFPSSPALGVASHRPVCGVGSALHCPTGKSVASIFKSARSVGLSIPMTLASKTLPSGISIPNFPFNSLALVSTKPFASTTVPRATCLVPETTCTVDASIDPKIGSKIDTN